MLRTSLRITMLIRITNEEYANRYNVTKNRASTIKYDTKQLIKKLINEYNSL